MFNSGIKRFSRGLIFNGTKVCLINEYKNSRWVWNFPGGKIEKGESEQEAVIREIKEELGVNCLKSELMFSSDFVFNDNPWRGYYFKCQVSNYDFTLESIANDFGFFDFNDIQTLTHGIPDEVMKKLNR